MLHCRLQPLMPRHAESVIAITNPNEAGVRSRFTKRVTTLSAVMMDYAVVKPATRYDTKIAANTYQGAYENRWESNADWRTA